MKIDKVYIVEIVCGEFYDYTRWIDGIYSTREEAEKHVKHVEEKIKTHVDECSNLMLENEDKYSWITLKDFKNCNIFEEELGRPTKESVFFLSTLNE